MRLLIAFVICMMSLASSFAQYSKMSPYAKLVARESVAKMSDAKGIAPVKSSYLTAFVRTSDKKVLESHACKILAQWDDIYIAAIPLTEINSLALEKQVSRIEAGESCMVTNDTASVITKARNVWNNKTNKTGYTGKGVVVGVMDVGFDLTHPTFLSADKTTCRIKRLWDMLDYSDGGEPVTGEKIEGGYFVGRQYIGSDAILQKKYSADGLIENHGTHTAGTVAGSGEYSGMAPEADICLVANAVSTNLKEIVPEQERYKYTTATDMLGFKYIFDYAESVGKPCVISFSEGSHDDLYQSGLYGEVLSKLLGPGKILCSSAGNERNANETYLRKPKGQESGGGFLVKSNSNTGVYVLRSQKPVKMSLSFYQNGTKVKDWEYDCTALAAYPDSVMTDTIDVENQQFTVMLNTYPSCFDESLYATDLFVVDVKNKDLGITVPVALKVIGADDEVEGFCGGGYFKKNALDASLDNVYHTHNVLFPGSCKSSVCVGAVSYRDGVTNISGVYQRNHWGRNGVIAPFSGCGPSIAGDIKPDVVAPGAMIVSAMNSYWREQNPTLSLSVDVKKFDYNGRSYGWTYKDGTSMATPVAAGIVALWLQACPTLTPEEVKDIIAQTAKHYDSSMPWPNNDYGYGEIDAEKGLKYLHGNYFETTDVNKDGVTDINDVNAIISVICGEK